MTPYILYFLSFVLFIPLDFMDKTKEILLLRKFALFFLFFVICFFCGLRYYSGLDWGGLMEYYNHLTWDNQQYEIGFKILNLLCKEIFDSYFAVQFFASVIFAYALLSFFEKYATYTFLAIFIAITLYFLIMTAQMRQQIAISILILGIKFLINKMFFKWCLVVVIASCFHISAVFYIFLYILTFRVNKNFLLILAIGSFFISQNTIVFLLQNFMPFFPEKLVVISDRYIKFIAIDKGTTHNTGIYFFSFQFLLFILIILYKPIKDKTLSLIILNSLICFIIFKNMSFYLRVMERLLPYIYMLSIIPISSIFSHRFFNKYKIIRFIVVILCILYFLFPVVYGIILRDQRANAVITSKESYIPYLNLLFNHDEKINRIDWNGKTGK